MKVLCVEKFRDKNGVIKGYRIKYENGTVQDVKAEELKANIKSGQIEVVNLTLTVDGKLVDKGQIKEQHKVVEKKFEDKEFEQLCKKCGFDVDIQNSNKYSKCSKSKALGWGSVLIEKTEENVNIVNTGYKIIVEFNNLGISGEKPRSVRSYSDTEELVKDIGKITGILGAVNSGKKEYKGVNKFAIKTVYCEAIPEVNSFEAMIAIFKAANKLEICSKGFLNELVGVVNKVGKTKLKEHLTEAGYKSKDDVVEVADDYGNRKEFNAEEYAICLLLTLNWIMNYGGNKDICNILLIYSNCYKELLNYLDIYKNCQKLVEKIIA